jgi:hypothetical protein
MSASFYGLKINKSETPDKTPYTLYYPHDTPSKDRDWTKEEYFQVVSIDPARKNYAMRIERRYKNGWITPIVFDKVSIESIEKEGENIINDTYKVLTKFLDKYKEFYDGCHYIIVERQLPKNYKAVRISQHTISYFLLYLSNKPLLPSIIEIDSQLKGKMLGAPKGMKENYLKTWSVEKAKELLTMREDNYSLDILKVFKRKQDDLSDTVCQIEALFIYWGLGKTVPPPKTKKINICKIDE